MEEGFLGLPIHVSGTDGIKYEIRPYEASIESLERLWSEAGQYSFLFSEFSENDRDYFVNYFISPGVVVLEVFDDDAPVGLLYADQLRLQHSARVHYFFSDRKQKTREPVLLAALAWFMDSFNLNRVSIEIPWHAYSALRRVQAMRIFPEGIRRGSIKHNGKWRDEILFGVLHEELTDEVIARGYLEREGEESRWFGLLDNDKALSRAIFKRE